MSTSGSNRPPRRLLLVSLLFLVTLAVNFLIMIAYRERNRQSFIAAFMDKQELMQNTPSPRIILVGGSSVAFGFDSNELSSQVGLPVVNLGLQGGLGLRFELESIKSYLREGDIIILSPEYHNILGKLHSGEILAQIVALYPNTIRYFSTGNEVWQLIRAFPSVHTSAIKNMLEDLKLRHCLICANREPIYYRAVFDKSTGDIINEAITIKESPFELKLDFDLKSKEFSKSIELLNNFASYAAAGNITVFFYYPSSINVNDSSTATILDQLSIRLNSELIFPILNSLKGSQFESEYMFDTAYHLNEEGKAINTRKLGEQLCSADLFLPCK